MIKGLFFYGCRTIAYVVLLLVLSDCYAQVDYAAGKPIGTASPLACDLRITNPPCQATPVDITVPAITAGSTNIGTLSYWTNATATVALANPNAVAASGIYYIKNVSGACTDIKPVAVTVGGTPPTDTTVLFVECLSSNPTSVFFDFHNVGQVAFYYSYTIDGGTPIVGTQTSPSSHLVTGLLPGQLVTFTLTYVGICIPPLTTSGYPPRATDFPYFDGMHLCAGTVLATTSPNGISGTWNKPVVLLGSNNNYKFTPPQCNLPINITIVGDAKTDPTFSPIAPICEGSAAPALPANSNNATPIPGTWNPSTINTSTAGTFNFTFTPNAGQCANTKQISVTISPKPTPTFSIPGLATSGVNDVCQNAVVSALPTSSTNSPAITGTWNPSAVNTATLGLQTYTFTPTAGQCVAPTPVTIKVNVKQNITPTFNITSPVCQGSTPQLLPANSNNATPISGTWNPTTISTSATGDFVYTFTPTAGQCATAVPVHVIVNPNITPVFNAFGHTLSICSGDVVPILPTTSSAPNPVTGTWNVAAISNTVSGVYTFTPNSGCATNFVLTVTVNPKQTIQFTTLPANFSICIGTTPPSLPLSSNNTTPITGTWSPSTISTFAPGTTIYTFTAAAGQCVTSQTYTTTVKVTSKTTPVFDPVPAFCEGSFPPQGLTLPTVSNDGVVGSWNPPIINNTVSPAPRSYTFTPAANQCANPVTIQVTVTPKTIPDFLPIAPFCSGGTAPVLPLVSNNGISGTWSPATVDNTITASYLFTPDATNICVATATLTVTVNQPIDPNFNDIVICAGETPPTLQNTSPNLISGTWAPLVIDPTTGGPYVFTPNAGECANEQTINVTINQLTLNNVTWTVSDYFSNDATITITATDPGNYLYQIDQGPLYETNVFHHVSHGPHTITVYDANGCSPAISNGTMVIDYPHYFTPNGDGIGDTWNIFDLLLVNQEAATIFIFDRYGKLLKEIGPAGLGWDGTYHGQPMPSSDYWFLVNYSELGVSREFKAHFSLKR